MTLNRILHNPERHLIAVTWTAEHILKHLRPDLAFPGEDSEPAAVVGMETQGVNLVTVYLEHPSFPKTHSGCGIQPMSGTINEPAPAPQETLPETLQRYEKTLRRIMDRSNPDHILRDIAASAVLLPPQ